MPRKLTLRQKIEQQIARKKGDDVFLTREFKKLGGQDQVLRVLRALVHDGRLVRLGYGVYGRATRSRLTGKPMLNSPQGFWRGAPGPRQTRCRMEAVESRARLQRGPVHAGAGQPGGAGKRALLTPPPLPRHGAAA